MKKSFMTRMLAVSLSAAMTFSLSSASSLTATEAAAKKLPANNKAVSISLKVGNSKVLKLKNYKAWNIKKGATNKKAVAAVANKGTAAKRTIKVTAKKAGTAKVTLTLGKRKTADSATTKYSKTIKKVVTVKVKAADTNTDTTPTDTTTTPTDTTTTPTTPTTTTDSAVNVTPGVLHISQASATHADTIAVSFSSIVASTGAVKVTVTRGTGTEPMEGSFSWAAGAMGGEFKSVGKLTKGTYTVTATDGKETTTATVEVAESQEVKSIEFIGETALTGRGTDNTVGREAYIYYDVKDQYGDSVRDQFSIQLTASAEITHTDRATGRITLKKNNSSNNEVFTYADKIYVTGVYTKTGVTNSATYSVGTEQSVNTIKFVGFIKKGTTDILEKLPKDFKANEYQLLYDAFDQNDNQMEAGDYLYEDGTDRTRSLTFVSDNVLVLKEILNNNDKTVTIKGTDYCVANVMPGINVNAGGTVNLSAIATKTGQKSDISVLVGDYRILKKFELLAPAGYVIDGESVEIPFVAEDAEGNKMTLFKELATQSNFSKLTFNQSVGNLYLEELDNGNARLVWDDSSTAEGRWNSSSTNDIERPISLTAIVVGGETSNEMIQVSDKARPEGIAGVNIDPVLVDDKGQDIRYDMFTFVDQYGRNMRNTYWQLREKDLPMDTKYFTTGTDPEKYIYDNGFFAANADPNIKFSGTDFTGYEFGIDVELTGWSGNLKKWSNNFTQSGNDLISFTTTGSAFKYNNLLNYVAKEDSAKIPEVTLKCRIQKRKEDGAKEVEDVSKKYTTSFKIAPLDKLSNFRTNDLNKVNIETAVSDADNGQKFADSHSASDLAVDLIEGSPNVTGNILPVLNDNGNGVELKVLGNYGTTTVELPKEHYAMKNNNALISGAGKDYEQVGYDRIVGVMGAGEDGLQYRDLYDVTTAHYNPKDATDTIEVDVFPAAVTTTSLAAIQAEGKDIKDLNPVTTIKTTAYISDSYNTLTTFEAADAVTLKPGMTRIALSRLMTDAKSVDSLAYQSKDHKIVIKDQYNTEFYVVDANEICDVKTGKHATIANAPTDASVRYDLEFEYLVKDLVENKDGYVDGNLKVRGNASSDALIEGAEMGDTFTVEITAKAYDITNDPYVVGGQYGAIVDGNVTKTVKVTVGADSMCYIHDNDNHYSDTSNKFDKDGQLEERISLRDELQYQLNELLGTDGNQKK